MKKAPKKKVKGYMDGGVTQLQVMDQTPNDIKFKPKRKKKGEGSFGDVAADVGRVTGKTALGIFGLDDLVKDNYKTEAGANADKISEKYVQPALRAVGTAALTATAGPGAGAAYNSVTSGLDKSVGANQTAINPGETEDEYAARMAKSGIDIYDPSFQSQQQGLQGQESAIGGGILSLFNRVSNGDQQTPVVPINKKKMYDEGFKDGGNISKSKAKEMLKDGTAHGHPLTDKQKKMLYAIAGGKSGGGVVGKYGNGGSVKTAPKEDFYTSYYNKLNKYETIDPLDPKKYNDVKSDIGKVITPKMKKYQESLNNALMTKYNLKDLSGISGQHLSIDEMKGALGEDYADYEKAFNAYEAYRTKTNAVIPVRNTEGTVNTDKLIYGKRNVNLFAPYKEEELKPDGYSEGGDIKGKGTTKSDSIKAKVEDGSFVVPAENADIAKLIREKYLPGTQGKADLKQGGGVNVRLSNKEHLFTPEEKELLLDNGVNLSKLAPNAKESNKYADGTKFEGVKDERQRKLLKDIDTLNNEIDEAKKQRGSQSQVSANNYIIKEKQRKLKQLTDQYKSSYTIPAESEAKSGEANIAGNIISGKNKNTNVGSVGNYSSRVKYNQPATESTASDSESNKEKKAIKYGASATKSDYENEVASIKAANSKAPNSKALSLYNKEVADINEANTPKKGNKLKISAEDVLAGAQMGAGIYSLFKDGKRPVDTLDKDFQQSVTAAKTAAQTGFDDATKQQYLSSIESARKGVVDLAAGMSGGDPTRALANARAATNQYGKGLVDFLAADTSLRQQKQQYADQLVAQKASMNRQLFNDKMRAFDINQAAGADLLSSGIENFFGSRMRKQQLEAQQKANQQQNFDFSNAMLSFLKQGK